VPRTEKSAVDARGRSSASTDASAAAVAEVRDDDETNPSRRSVEERMDRNVIIV
jgi:hypothetical protein